MISREVFLEILYEKSMTFTSSELMEMLDEELAKPIDEMDTDLIDNCLNALKGAYDKE